LCQHKGFVEFMRDSKGEKLGTVFVMDLLNKLTELKDVHECVRLLTVNDDTGKFRGHLKKKAADAAWKIPVCRILFPQLSQLFVNGDAFLDPKTLPVARVDETIFPFVDVHEGNDAGKSAPNLAEATKKWLTEQSKTGGNEEKLRVMDVRTILKDSTLKLTAGLATNGLELLDEDVQCERKKHPAGWHFTSYFDLFLLDAGGGEIGSYCFGMSPAEVKKWKECGWDACDSPEKPTSFAMGRKKKKHAKAGCFFEEFVFPSRDDPFCADDDRNCHELDVECFKDEAEVRARTLKKAESFAKLLVDTFHMNDRTIDTPIEIKSGLTGVNRKKCAGKFMSKDKKNPTTIIGIGWEDLRDEHERLTKGSEGYVVGMASTQKIFEEWWLPELKRQIEGKLNYRVG
jgi:hypothetical protein